MSTHSIGRSIPLITLDTHPLTLAFLKILQYIIVRHSNILFFPWTIVEWNKLDLQCRKATYVFRNHLVKSIRSVHFLSLEGLFLGIQ